MADPDYVSWALQTAANNRAQAQFEDDQYALFAKRMAAQRVAQGDYSGASGALAGTGDVQGTQALQQGGAMQTALQAEGAGDVQSARAAAATTGVQSSYDAAQQGAMQTALQKAGALHYLADQISAIKAPPGGSPADLQAARSAAVQRFASTGLLQSMGVSDQTLNALQSAPLDDASISAYRAQIPYTGVLKGDGGVETAYNGGNVTAQGYVAPIKLDPGQTLVRGAGGPPIASSDPLPVATSPGTVLKDPRTGRPLGTQTPFERKPVNVSPGDTATGYDPNTNTYGGPTPPPGTSPSPAQVGMVEPGGAPGGSRHVAAWAGATAGSSPQAGPGAPSAYAPQIAAAEQRYGLPQGLLAGVINRGEASGPNAVSPKGAVGIAQLMPGTAAELGVNPQDPGQSIDGAARYLAQNLKRFGGDPRLAVAAYNAGPQAVADHGGVPPYPETQAFVSRVLGPQGVGQPQPAQGVASIPGQRIAPPAYNPQTQKWEQTGPDGKVTAVADNPMGSEKQLTYTSNFIGTPQYKDYMQLQQFHNTALAALKQAGGPSDLQLLDMALKSNNPTLGIRPNQVDQMKDEMGLPNKFAGELRALVQNGQALSPSGRQALVNVIDNARAAAWTNLQPLISKAQRDAQRYGLQTADLIPDVSGPGAAAPPSSGYGPAQTQIPQGGGVRAALSPQQTALVALARSAIQRGAPRDRVAARLQSMGVDPGQL